MANESSAEDRRAAAGIRVSLSSYLISAALTVLGVQVALITFALDKREGLLLFGVISLAGATSLLASLVVGGIGIAEAYKNGYEGKWQVASGWQFQAQPILALLGVTLVAVSALLGRTKGQSPDPATLAAEIEVLRAEVNLGAVDRQSFSERLRRVEEDVKNALEGPSQRQPSPPRKRN